MLKIHFGHLPETLKVPSEYFDLMIEPDDEIFSNSFIKDIIYSIDSVRVNSALDMYNEKFRVACNYTTISTGSKNTILAYLTDEVIDGDKLGDNCAPWILKIAEDKDVTITLEHLLKFPENIHALILNDNTEVNSFDEYLFSYIDNKNSWCGD